jgi:GMP synthase (glutamine-hydrolysing)
MKGLTRLRVENLSGPRASGYARIDQRRRVFLNLEIGSLMRKVLVFQHVAHEILGTLNPLLKNRGFRIRYVNFDRHPNTEPSVEKYDGLVVLGGNMGVYEAESYPHIKVEMKLIEQALAKNIPVLGICLGAQILAHVLGSEVRKSGEKEIGWYDLHLTDAGRQDPLFAHFRKSEKVFQLHGDTFDVPKTAEHLASSDICPGQAFRYGEKAYGIQFHLEVDRGMIERWLKNPVNKKELDESGGKFDVHRIMADTEARIERSLEVSRLTFQNWIEKFGSLDRPVLLGSEHGKPGRD